MGYGYAYNSTGTVCSDGPQAGTQRLQDHILAKWPRLTNGGIWNCRSVRGGSQLSMHGEGRAGDCMVPTLRDPLGYEVAGWLVEHADTLGIQEVIWNRRRWDSRYRKWSSYDGIAPHEDHVHWGQCWAAARLLTQAAIDSTDGDIDMTEDQLRAIIADELKKVRTDDMAVWQLEGNEQAIIDAKRPARAKPSVRQLLLEIRTGVDALVARK